MTPVILEHFKCNNVGMCNIPNQCVIVEDYTTGKTTSRRTLNWVMGMVKKGSVDKILCYRTDRIIRNARTSLEIAEACVARKVSIYANGQKVDWDTANGRLIYLVLAGLAQHESELISERVKLAYETQKREAEEKGEEFVWGGRAKGQVNKWSIPLIKQVRKQLQLGYRVKYMAKINGVEGRL